MVIGSKSKNLFITTPIYYVNAAPHIGHLYSSVIADAIQRWHKLKQPNRNIKFSTGTDEHGMKIQQAAAKHKAKEENYCAEISEKYKQLSNDFSINYTDFIRTSSVEHKNAVQQFWKAIDRNGFIYTSQYKGWYCVSDETFLPKSQVKYNENVGSMVSTETGHPVEWTEESNYVFKLSSLADDLRYWLRRNEQFVRPKKFHQILMQIADSDAAMCDISLSRPTSRVHWAIPVPETSDQSVYVWMDALVHYLTAAGYPDTESSLFQNTWPPDIQVIGKDILKFHGIYWPAFLMAAKLELPRTIFCHSHWMVDGHKMSKSKNNVVCPFELEHAYTSDGLRYFLLREGVSHSDGNYSDVKARRILNSELADTFGNLLSRCCSKALNSSQQIPTMDRSTFAKLSNEEATLKSLLFALEQLPDQTNLHYSEMNFYKVVDTVISTLHMANQFVETMKPWQLNKSTTTLNQLNVVLHVAFETLRVAAIVLQPVIPNLSHSLLNQLNVPHHQRYWNDILTLSWQNETNINRPLSNHHIVLYNRILSTDKSRIKQNI